MKIFHNMRTTIRRDSIRALLGIALTALPIAAQASQNPLQIRDAWSRPAIGTGIVYLTAQNTGTKSVLLLSASTPVAAGVEFHRSCALEASSTMQARHEQRAQTATDAALREHRFSAESMERVDHFRIAAGGKLILQPGGQHMMLMGLRRPLVLNERFPLLLRYGNHISQRIIVHVVER